MEPSEQQSATRNRIYTGDLIFERFVMLLTDEQILSLPKGITTAEMYQRFPETYEMACKEVRGQDG